MDFSHLSHTYGYMAQHILLDLAILHIRSHLRFSTVKHVLQPYKQNDMCREQGREEHV